MQSNENHDTYLHSPSQNGTKSKDLNSEENKREHIERRRKARSEDYAGGNCGVHGENRGQAVKCSKHLAVSKIQK